MHTSPQQHDQGHQAPAAHGTDFAALGDFASHHRRTRLRDVIAYIEGALATVTAAEIRERLPNLFYATFDRHHSRHPIPTTTYTLTAYGVASGPCDSIAAACAAWRNAALAELDGDAP